MQAYQCDRCGKLYVGYDVEHELKWDGVKLLTLRGNGFSFCHQKSVLATLDLCKDCYCSLVKWFGEKQYKIENLDEEENNYDKNK